MGYTVPDEASFAVEDYEYGVQVKIEWNGKWSMVHTNHFHGWYPSKASANNALAQLNATRYGYPNNREHRLVRRPFGATEVV